jgi:hypothetical protein
MLGSWRYVENSGGVELHHCALVENCDAIGQCECLGAVVRDVESGEAEVDDEFPKFCHEAISQDSIK